MNGLDHSSLTLQQGQQGPGQDASPGDSKLYEFDRVCSGSSSAEGSASAPLSPPEEFSGPLGDSARGLSAASTASVSPQSPGDADADPFSMGTLSDFTAPPEESSHVSEDVMTSAPPPGGPVSASVLQEIGVYGAPPPEENGDLLGMGSNDLMAGAAPNSNNLVCLDEDGMEMPTTQAPAAPPSNPFSHSLIDTQAPMGQFDLFATGINGAQAGTTNPFDSIPGQPPIGFAPPSLQPREAFVEPVPAPQAQSAAPGGPAQPAATTTAAPAQPSVQTSPRPGMPPKNEPLFVRQPGPYATGVKESTKAEALLLEDVPANTSSTAVPPLDLSSFDPMATEARPAPAAVTKPAEPPAEPDASKIPSPKRAKPGGGTSPAAPQSAKTAPAKTATNKAPAKKVAAPPSSSKATPAASQKAPAKASPRESVEKKPAAAASPRTATPSKVTPAKATPAKASPRQPPAPAPARQSPRTSATKGFNFSHSFHITCISSSVLIG